MAAITSDPLCAPPKLQVSDLREFFTDLFNLWGVGDPVCLRFNEAFLIEAFLHALQ